MYRQERRGGFSLIELLLVIAIISMLAALLMAMGPKMVAKARAMECIGNIKSISYALTMYQTNYGTFPPDGEGSFLSYLLPYFLDNEDAMHCPRDPVPGHNSYENLYVSRPEGDSPMGLTVVCQYHLKDDICVVSTFDGSTHMGKPKTVFADGNELRIGETIKGNSTITFADGSTLKPSGKEMRTTLIASYRDDSGRLYTVIRAYLSRSGKTWKTGKIKTEVTPGSRFEVITPAAIAGVHGTKFTVDIEQDGNEHTSVVAVQEGAVSVLPSNGDAEEMLYAGDSKQVTCTRPPYEGDDDDDD